MRVLLSACVCGLAGLAGLPASAQTAGVQPVWEVQKDLATLTEHVKRLKPILEQAKPAEWAGRGAPAGYVDQGKRVDAELGYVLATAQQLSSHPDRLTKALETYFRMQSLDLMLRSYAAGIRKYQNAALAELLEGALVDATADREKLRQYLVDLSAEKEQEFRVADEEAQRCRSMLTRQPRPGGRARKEAQQ